MQLTQKEKMLLEDLRGHEETFIQKCSEYANQAQDPQLRQIFRNLVNHEQQHVQTISQKLTQGGAGQTAGQSMTNQKDAILCQDMLSSEKYLSSAYNMAIFEMKDPTLRQDLNGIQTDKQKHGEELFNYMQSKGMYQVH
jgi:spore coat protein CotF